MLDNTELPRNNRGYICWLLVLRDTVFINLYTYIGPCLTKLNIHYEGTLRAFIILVVSLSFKFLVVLLLRYRILHARFLTYNL